MPGLRDRLGLTATPSRPDPRQPGPDSPDSPNSPGSHDGPGGPGSRGRTAVRSVLAVGLGLVVTIAWAWAAVAVLDASNFPDARRAIEQRTFDAAAVVPSVAVVWVAVLLVVALVGRLWLGLGVATALVTLLAFVNTTKLELRNDPLVPSDVAFLSQPGFLGDMVSRQQLVLAVGGLVALVAGGWVVGRLVGTVLPNPARAASPRGRWVVRGTRLLVAAVTLGLLWTAGNFNDAGNPWRAAYDDTGLRWRSWDQRVNYQKNGFVAGLLYNTHVEAMKEPPGYSKAAVEALAAKYAARASDLNRGRTGSLDDVNVVTVLSESFSQPAWLKTVRFPRDVIPRTTATMGTTVSGRMLTPGYGSGTANTEFELLTGQSLGQLSPQLSVPFEQMVSNYQEFPSLVGWLRARGHTPIAIHPFQPRMYDRPAVYDAFGFEKFITKDQMSFKGRGGGRFIDDRSAFDEVLAQIRSHREPVMTHLVTMQNHMPYGGQYDDPIAPTGLPKQYAGLAAQYARGLARTDEALAEFMAKLRTSEEPTVVVFYGDHLPPQVYPPDLVRREGLRTTHETPWLVWSNRKALRHTDLPTTSATQFLPTMFDAMDVPVPPWYALLDAVRAQVPAMDAGLLIDADDREVEEKDLSPAAKKVLADYRMIQYDLSIGKRWSEKAMFGDAPGGSDN